MTDRSALSRMKIAVVDDHDLVREGLRAVLLDGGADDVDRYPSAEGLLSALEGGSDYDILILDLELPDMDGFTLIERIRNRNPEARIIVSTVHDEIWTLRRLLASGVNAVVYKSGESGEILTAIGELLEGNRYYCSEVRDALGLAEDRSLHPTSRELEVLRLIARGKTTKEIADTMFVSVNTVEAHRRSLLSRLGAVNMVDLIMKGVEKGYIGKNFK